jgi:hypothetical protein
MASIQTKASILSIKKETTEAVPVPPAAATDFVALTDAFSLQPSVNVLTNAEIKASIGQAKPIAGAEAPTASLDAYLRHSGVEGQAPNYGVLLESCLGSVATAATEYDTIAGSTTTSFKVGSGEGVNFQRGQALLLKDATNGYRVRVVDSVSGDDLSASFQVPVAPASGVNLGKAVTYKPANTGHPTVTMWHYLGNGGAVQMMAGGRVTSASFSISAGELINGSYSVEGVSYFFDPIEITSSTRFIDFTDDDGTFAAAVSAGFYKDPHELAAAIKSAMDATASTKVYSVSYQDTDGKFKIAGQGTLLTLKWNTGANTANTIATKIGFSAAADSTGASPSVGYTSATALGLAASYTPSFDAADPLVAKNQEVMIGDQDDYLCFGASAVTVTIDTPKADIPSVCAQSGIAGSIINARTVTINVSAQLSQYDADKFRRLRDGSNTKFQYTFGVKDGGNWVAGKCGVLYCPTGVVQNPVISDADGLAQISFDIVAYVGSDGAGEFYISFV